MALSMMDTWVLELQGEYRNRLRDLEKYKAGSNEHEMTRAEAKDILRLMNFLHSNYGIGYPLLKNLKGLIEETPFPYVKEKAQHIYSSWASSTI